MPNRTEARSAKAARTNATGRLPLLRLFSTLLIDLSSVNSNVIGRASVRCTAVSETSTHWNSIRTKASKWVEHN